MTPTHPRVRGVIDLSGMLLAIAGAGAKAAYKKLRPKRRGAFLTRRPGPESPMWNAFAVTLNEELKPHGSKVRLARYLGIPKQRLSDFLAGKSRMPDAEVTLQLLCWLAEKRTGRDISV